MGGPRGSEIERFFAKIDFVSQAPCWIWIGCINRNGYGAFRRIGYSQPAHRSSWELLVGVIPIGLTIDHLCKVRACVNPDHLEPVTLAENIQRFTRTIINCPQGHPYIPGNTKITSHGARACRECARNDATDYRRRKKLWAFA